MSATVVIVLIIGAVGLVALMAVMRARASRDGVDSFRRQIDALSPEARRPVIDQVQNAAGRMNGHDEDDADSGADSDEDGLRGT